MIAVSGFDLTIMPKLMAMAGPLEVTIDPEYDPSGPAAPGASAPSPTTIDPAVSDTTADTPDAASMNVAPGDTIDDPEWNPEEDFIVESLVWNDRPLLSAIWHFIRFAVLMAILHGILLFSDLRAREAAAERLRAELIQSQLLTLRMQLNPHFLFNTLNSISSLMSSDIAGARRMLTDLSDLLRASIQDVKGHEVTVRQELEFLQGYIDIQRVRFGDRLTFEIEMQRGIDGAMLPVLCLQPLVENAILHGAGSRAGPGQVQVTVARDGNELNVEVFDDGPGPPNGLASQDLGLGLTNTVARVAQLYGDAGQLDFYSPPGGGFTVRIRIPYHEDVHLPGDGGSNDR